MLTCWCCWHALYGHPYPLCKRWLAGVADMFCIGILILCVNVDLLVLLTCSVWALSSSKCWLAGVVDMFCMGILIPDWDVYIYMFKLSVSCPREPMCLFQLPCLREPVFHTWLKCVCVSVVMPKRACVLHFWLNWVCVCVFQLPCPREHVCFIPDWSMCVF